MNNESQYNKDEKVTNTCEAILQVIPGCHSKRKLSVSWKENVYPHLPFFHHQTPSFFSTL